VLPTRHPLAGPDGVLLDVARLDRSGRMSVRGLLKALGWRAGQKVDVDVVDGAVVFRSTATGRHAIGGRGELVVPAAVRQLCSIHTDQPVLLAAYPPVDLIIIHTVATVARLLADRHLHLLGGSDGG
jgi:hypothetical protein